MKKIEALLKQTPVATKTKIYLNCSKLFAWTGLANTPLFSASSTIWL